MDTITLIKFLVAAVAGVLTGISICHLCHLYWRTFMPRLGVKNVELGCETFLNGYQVWRWERDWTFTRIGRYIGHGLCYEASALLMLVWKDYKKTRYVFGRAYSTSEKGRVDHSWMEVKAYGIWWVFDTTWIHPTHPIPRLLHHLEHRVFPVRKISHREFFSHETARNMAEMIKDPKTSYLFHDLCLFRRSKNTRKMILEVYHDEKFTPRGECSNPLLVAIFKDGRPITQRVISEFIVHKNRELPKRRTWRKARVLEKTMDRYFDEAKVYHDKTGERPVLKLTSLKTFEILSVKQAEALRAASS